MNETSSLTYEQGEKLDIIGEELFETYRNVRDARENVAEANEHQRRARSKYVYLSILLLLGVAVGVMVILF
jgi:t-SNARE complex subunit (syntaxin)